MGFRFTVSWACGCASESRCIVPVGFRCIGVGESFTRSIDARIRVGLSNVELRHEQGLSVPETSSGAAGLWPKRYSPGVVGVYGKLRAVA